jgi:hypothetical protein
MKCRVAVFSVLLVSYLVSYVLAQESRPVLRGVWSATAGASAFRGRWSAEIDAPDAASGSWTLLDDSNRIILEGTWSARRVNAPAKLTVPHLQGTWTARAGAGRALSGTWQADLAGFSGKTFEDMLKRTVEQQVSGSWHSGRTLGDWWLQGSKW